MISFENQKQPHGLDHEFFHKLSHTFFNFLFSFWSWLISFALLFSFLSYAIEIRGKSYDESKFSRLIFKYLILILICCGIYYYYKKFGTKPNFYFYHDALEGLYVIGFSIILIYTNFLNRNEFLQQGKYYYMFANQIFSIVTIIPWMTIINKKIKTMVMIFSETLIISFTIYDNSLDTTELVNTCFFLILKVLINYKICKFNEILYQDIYQANLERKEESLRWRKIIDELPNSYLIIQRDVRKILFMNHKAKSLLKIPVYDESEESFQRLSASLGRVRCWSNLIEVFQMNSQSNRNNYNFASSTNLLDFEIQHKTFTISEFLSLLSELNKRHLFVKEEIVYLETEEDQDKKIAVRVSLDVSFSGIDCFGLILEDITFRKIAKQLNREIEYKGSQIMMLNSVSHGIRSPLNNSIPSLQMGICSFLNDDKLPTGRLKPAIKSMPILHLVVSLIVDFNSTQRSFSIEKTSLKEIMDSLFSVLEPHANQKSLALNFRIDREVDDLTYCDSQRLSIILMILISNGIKCTSKGDITLAVSKHSNEKLKFTIIDTGIGIKDEIADNMNSFFSKKTYSSSDLLYFNDSSICLGLNLSNKLAYAISDNDETQKSGLILDYSKENKGSSFSFLVYNHDNAYRKSNQLKMNKSFLLDSLSYQISNYEDESSSKSDISYEENWDEKLLNERSFDNNNIRTKLYKECESPFLNMNMSGSPNKEEDINNHKCKCASILIVDNDPFNQMTLQLILKKFHVASVSANHGKEAIQLLKKKKVSQIKCKENCSYLKLMFMDYQMPVMDGVEATIHLRKLTKQKNIDNIIIIGCTAFGTTAETENFRQAGIDDLLIKPIDLAKMRQTLRKWNIIGMGEGD